MSQPLTIMEFRHTSTSGFYLVAGKERVATATYTRLHGWRLVWTATQAAPITGPDALSVVAQALDVWPTLAPRLEKASDGTWSVPAEVGVSRAAVPMGGQPGYRRR